MEHSKHGFSGLSRWIEDACPASLRMSSRYSGSTNPAAELGTAAHELGEFCLNLGVNTYDCIGLEFNKHIVDEPMAEASAVYVSYIRSLEVQYRIRARLEQRVTMTSLGRSDVFGTSDCAIIALQNRILHIADYKHGYGLVEVIGNPQLPGYGVSTLDTFDLWDKVDTVIVTIIQPRAQHIDGPIRTTSYTIAEMRLWQQKIARSVVLTEDKTQRPKAGSWCRYCPARGNCRARMMLTLQTAYRDCPLDEVSPGETEILFSELSGVETHLKAIAARALDLGREGHVFGEYKLVKSIVKAKCHDEEALIADAIKQGVDTSELFENKLVSMTKAKKVLPWQLVNKHYIKPPQSTTLVPLSNNRPAISVGSATGVFSAVNTQPTPSAINIFGEVK